MNSPPRSAQGTTQTAAEAPCGVWQVPVAAPLPRPSEHAAPLARPAQAACPLGIRSWAGSQAMGPVLAGPMLHTPLLVPEPIAPGMEQVSPAACLAQASMAAWGGVIARPHTSPVEPPAAMQVPDRVSPKASVTVQESPEVLPVQAAVSS